MTGNDPQRQLNQLTNTLADISRRSTMQMVEHYDPDEEVEDISEFVANRQTQATLRRYEA